MSREFIVVIFCLLEEIYTADRAEADDFDIVFHFGDLEACLRGGR